MPLSQPEPFAERRRRGGRVDRRTDMWLAAAPASASLDPLSIAPNDDSAKRSTRSTMFLLCVPDKTRLGAREHRAMEWKSAEGLEYKSAFRVSSTITTVGRDRAERSNSTNFAQVLETRPQAVAQRKNCTLKDHETEIFLESSETTSPSGWQTEEPSRTAPVSNIHEGSHQGDAPIQTGTCGQGRSHGRRGSRRPYR